MSQPSKTKHGVAYSHLEDAHIEAAITLRDEADFLGSLTVAPEQAPVITERRRTLLRTALSLVTAGNRARSTFERMNFAVWRA